MKNLSDKLDDLMKTLPQKWPIVAINILPGNHGDSFTVMPGDDVDVVNLNPPISGGMKTHTHTVNDHNCIKNEDLPAIHRAVIGYSLGNKAQDDLAVLLPVLMGILNEANRQFINHFGSDITPKYYATFERFQKGVYFMDRQEMAALELRISFKAYETKLDRMHKEFQERASRILGLIEKEENETKE